MLLNLTNAKRKIVFLGVLRSRSIMDLINMKNNIQFTSTILTIFGLANVHMITDPNKPVMNEKTLFDHNILSNKYYP